ncbi:MAG: glycerate kinase [Burkholderiaceae bacterium]|nr:glycerate kinase [Burkholderiaceae bacterium]MDO9088977.1 glycerate kinase [Burkholderiaceae bacterium]MDP1968530.1 glycerate kinase [Burkholderiaceae bacterium]
MVLNVPDPARAPRAFLEHLFRAAVRSALPLPNMAAKLPPVPRGRTLVIGAGKAGGSMAQAVEALWPAHAPLQGLVVTRYGHIPSRPEGLPRRIEVVEAAHPVPDAAGLAAAQRVLSLAQGLTKDDLALCLMSGGASALLTLPAAGLSLADMQRINQALLDSGAHIGEMNCVRKHLSRIKGGRLAAACAPARVVTLAISDVPGDDPSVIGSGPTVPDATRCAEALAILKHYRIALPQAVTEALERGELETPKPADAAFEGHEVHLIATPQQSLGAAAQAARDAGLAAHILADDMEGESREVGRVHAAMARAVARHGQPFARPCVILSGGETTVTLRPRDAAQVRGRGGRAGEFCLGLAQALQGQAGVFALAADTDGIDGVEDNAGAFVTPDTLVRAAQAGLRIEDSLARNDAYGYFEALGDLLVCGPTHTNVNDFRAVLIL